MIIIKSSIFAVIITFLLFIIFAIAMKIGNLDEKIIPPTNQVIRIISIALGGSMAAKASKVRGWLKGGITGIMYMFWAFVISALFAQSIIFNRVVLSDIAMSFIVGAIGGVIGVNLK
ncbi:MAG TPA: TIGR04086 family membrane protein [Clostridiales bacterium]|nr:TIGR04086 family membrane protein [Clostridiales bacterium]